MKDHERVMRESRVRVQTERRSLDPETAEKREKTESSGLDQMEQSASLSGGSRGLTMIDVSTREARTGSEFDAVVRTTGSCEAT